MGSGDNGSLGRSRMEKGMGAGAWMLLEDGGIQ